MCPSLYAQTLFYFYVSVLKSSGVAVNTKVTPTSITGCQLLQYIKQVIFDYTSASFALTGIIKVYYFFLELKPPVTRPACRRDFRPETGPPGGLSVRDQPAGGGPAGSTIQHLCESGNDKETPSRQPPRRRPCADISSAASAKSCATHTSDASEACRLCSAASFN